MDLGPSHKLESDAMPDQTIELQLPQVVAFPFPLQGKVDAWARSAQPPQTTPDCLNVWPYDRSLRGRGGVRPGTTKIVVTGVTLGSNYIQGFAETIVEDSTSGVSTTYFFVGCNGVLYRGSGSFTALAATTSFTCGTGRFLRMVGVGAFLYVLTGDPDSGGTHSIWKVDVAANTAASLTSSAGSLPTLARSCVLHRNRLVLFNTTDGNPQNFYMSRAGDPTDWDYGADDVDGAIEGNASKAGQVGEPITAMFSLDDDNLIIFCAQSVYRVVGEIRDGGSIVKLNGGVGCATDSAVTITPEGDLVWIGNGGLFRLVKYTLGIDNLSLDKLDSFFYNLDVSANLITVLWDRDRHGCWCFVTNSSSGNAHVWYDARTKGFFPIQFPDTQGPIRAIYSMAQGTGARTLLLGGRLGKYYKLDDSTANDDVTAITSYCWIGPIRPQTPIQEGKLQALDFVQGELPAFLSGKNWNLDWSLNSGSDANAALSNSNGLQRTGNFTSSGRQATQRNRVRGESFFVKLGNATLGSTWNIDQTVARFQVGGRTMVGQ